MSHRKFEAPRHGSLGFLPRKRAAKQRGIIRSFPQDNQSDKPHFTAFLGYKAGMTHIVREVHHPGSKLHKQEVCEAVTIIDCPPMVVVGIVGYVATPKGLRALTTVWAQHLSEEVQRRFYRNWYKAKHNCFTKYQKKYEDTKEIETELARLKKYCSVIRVIAHTQPSKLPFTLRKAHIMEVQINGGSIADKVDFAYAQFEKEVTVGDIFSKDEEIDHVAVTKGKGFAGVTKRFGVGILPRKTRRGIRRVACIGSWHPANVQYSVARAGQLGYHKRTEINKKVYMIGNGLDAKSATTAFDLTEKAITPMGGFPFYGEIRNDFVMLKGCVTGPKKRVITLRKAVKPQAGLRASEEITLKYIDTSSKIGHSTFSTSEEKKAFFGRQ